MSQETVKLSLDLDVPVAILRALVTRHLRRALRVAANGDSTRSTPEPQEEPAPAVPPREASAPVVTHAGAP